MKKRDLKVPGIDKYRYRELSIICRQYKKEKLALAKILNGHGIADLASTEGAAEIAHTANRYRQRIAAIEAAATAADAELREYILLNVSEGVSCDSMQPPCGRNQFYDARRAFFFELDKRL